MQPNDKRTLVMITAVLLLAVSGRGRYAGASENICRVSRRGHRANPGGSVLRRDCLAGRVGRGDAVAGPTSQDGYGLPSPGNEHGDRVAGHPITVA